MEIEFHHSRYFVVNTGFFNGLRTNLSFAMPAAMAGYFYEPLAGYDNVGIFNEALLKICKSALRWGVSNQVVLPRGALSIVLSSSMISNTWSVMSEAPNACKRSICIAL